MAKLFKVNILTEIAKPYASQEMQASSASKVSTIKDVSDVPNSWKNVIAYYSKYISNENRTCADIDIAQEYRVVKPLIGQKPEQVPVKPEEDNIDEEAIIPFVKQFIQYGLPKLKFKI